MSAALPSPGDLPARFPSFREAPPKALRAALRLERTLGRLGVGRGASLLLAVSGGADSAALACLMALVRPRLGLGLSIATCDHGLRPEGPDEVRFVRALGRLLGMETRAVSLGLDPSLPGVEDRARTARSAAVEAIRQETGADLSVLAHHAEDLREDVLLRLLRGTGWPGLGGMAEIDRGRRILRPLLGEEPGTLRAILGDLGVPHCEDASNADLHFARNRVRHVVLPALRKERPGVGRSLSALARLARTDEEFFAQVLSESLEKCVLSQGGDGTPASLFIPASVLGPLPKSLRLRLYLEAVRRLSRAGASGQARSETLFDLDDALEERRWPGVFQLPGGLELRLSRDGVEARGRP